jgi:hypothetical protein
MTLAMERPSSDRLDVGRVLQDALNVLGRNIVPFGLLALALVGVPAALAGAGQALAKDNEGYTILTALGGLAGVVTRPILQGAVFYGAMRDLEGERVSADDCLRAGRRRWGTLLALTIWSGLLVGLGVIFLVVPGVILALRWSVAGPIVALEGAGIQGAMERSARLTEGRRWAILLLFAIQFVAVLCAAGVIGIAGAGLSVLAPKYMVGAATEAITNILTDVSVATVGAVLFRQLRGDREGAAAATLAEVFA